MSQHEESLCTRRQKGDFTLKDIILAQFWSKHIRHIVRLLPSFFFILCISLQCLLKWFLKYLMFLSSCICLHTGIHHQIFHLFLLKMQNKTTKTGIKEHQNNIKGKMKHNNQNTDLIFEIFIFFPSFSVLFRMHQGSTQKQMEQKRNCKKKQLTCLCLMMIWQKRPCIMHTT